MIIQFTIQYIKRKINISALYSENPPHWSSDDAATCWGKFFTDRLCIWIIANDNESIELVHFQMYF